MSSKQDNQLNQPNRMTYLAWAPGASFVAERGYQRRHWQPLPQAWWVE